MTYNPKLDQLRFDTVTTGSTEKLWGAPAIAQALGVSCDTTYRLYEDRAANGVPIYKPGGRYFAFRSELMAWLRAQ